MAKSVTEICPMGTQYKKRELETGLERSGCALETPKSQAEALPSV